MSNSDKPIFALVADEYSITASSIIKALTDGDLSPTEAVEWVERLIRHNMTDSIVDQIREFNVLAGNTTDCFNPRQAALYTGLQLEEMSEKLHHLGFSTTARTLDSLGNWFKRGDYDDLFNHVDRVRLLDDDVDQLVVTIGSMLSMGVNIEGACCEVHRSNMSKVWPDGTLHKDANGKITKPVTYSEPYLAPFVSHVSGK